MDYNAWFEVYLDRRWFTFDARHNVPRIGPIIVARGRDAADVALVTSFGPHTLSKFRVWTEEIDDAVLADLTRRTAWSLQIWPILDTRKSQQSDAAD